jgi:cytoskeleton protein RodZ
MSDEELPAPGADEVQETPEDSKSAGQLLRQAREAKGVHIAALAVSLKVPLKKLEALEADRLDELPDAVFVRALASSVCRALKINPAPVLEQLPKLNTHVLDPVDRPVNVAFRSRVDGSAFSALGQLSSTVIVTVALLLLAALGLFFLPDFNVPTSPSPAHRVISDASTAPAGAASAAAGANETAAGGDQLTRTNSEIVQSSASLVHSSAPALSTLGMSHSTSTASVPSAATSSAPLPADSVIFFAATGETWIEVQDAEGKIILQRTLLAGEKAGVGPSLGKLPFSVIVGRANLTQVSVRGKAFDLAPVSSKDSVARFQIK